MIPLIRHPEVRGALAPSLEEQRPRCDPSRAAFGGHLRMPRAEPSAPPRVLAFLEMA